MEFEKEPQEATASGEAEGTNPAENTAGQPELSERTATMPEFAEQGLGPYREDGSFDYEAEAGTASAEAAALPAVAETTGGGAQPPAPPPPPKTPEEEE